jgi:hypothetical protein
MQPPPPAPPQMQPPPQPGAGFGWSAQTGGAGTVPARVPPSPWSQSDQSATDVELWTLYGVSAGYGVGTGVWLDAELGIDDPGLQFLAPGILGVAAPVTVFLLNRPRMPRGMPAAISAGMAIGAGEAVGITTVQYVHAKEGQAWGFRGFSRSVFIGSTLGAGAGAAAAYVMEPSPKTSLLVGSGVAWGTIIGSMFGYGGTQAGSSFGDANDKTAVAGLIGYNAGLLGAAALSTMYVPTYRSLAWMWAGFGLGTAVSLPVYLFYAGGDHDARRGLVFQGAAAMLGLAAGAVFTIDSSDSAMDSSTRTATSGANEPSTAPIQVTGAGLLPVPGGMGVQVSGLLF